MDEFTAEKVDRGRWKYRIRAPDFAEDIVQVGACRTKREAIALAPGRLAYERRQREQQAQWERENKLATKLQYVLALPALRANFSALETIQKMLCDGVIDSAPRGIPDPYCKRPATRLVEDGLDVFDEMVQQMLFDARARLEQAERAAHQYMEEGWPSVA